MNTKNLEAWHLKHKRKLSFRETLNPYAIWVSEIMLQQTKVDTVLPYFERFIKQYPTLKHLSETSEEALLKCIQGIGYYRRFKNMLKTSKLLIQMGYDTLPNDYKTLLKLPGIGTYTAGAIMSIAYNEPYSAVDGNVIRVLARQNGIFSDMRQIKHQKEIDKINQQLIIKATPRIYTEALMELGSEICHVKNPKCSSCPILETCYANRHQVISELPFLSKKKEKNTIAYIVLMIEVDHKIVLQKRTQSLLEGMYEYPMFESESIYQVQTILEEQGVFIEVLEKRPSYTHVFTHQKWYMDVYKVRLIKGKLEQWVFSDKDHIPYPMATAHLKIK